MNIFNPFVNAPKVLHPLIITGSGFLTDRSRVFHGYWQGTRILYSRSRLMWLVMPSLASGVMGHYLAWTGWAFTFKATMTGGC